MNFIPPTSARPVQTHHGAPLTLLTLVGLAASVGVLAALLYLLSPSDGENTALAQGVELALGGLALASIALLLWHEARHRRTQRSLAAEAAFRRAMESSLATGLRVLDPDGTTTYVNRAFCQMTGFAEYELMGRGAPYPYWPPELHALYQQQLREHLAGQAPAGAFAVVVRRRDGSRFDAQMHFSPLQDDTGHQLGWLTAITDVTEPKRIRNELAAAHDRFTTVLESLQAAVSVVATASSGRDELVFANRAYRERFGVDAAAHQRLAAVCGTAAAEAAVYDAESGGWFAVHERHLQWVDGRAARLQVATDVTARKAAEDAFREQQEKMHFTARLTTLGEMASSLAHELNQPLTAIANYCEGLVARARGGDWSPQAALPALEKTAAQARRAGLIVRRIREFVKRSAPRHRPTPIGQVLDEAIALAEIEARRKGIMLAVEVEPDLPPLEIDPLLIEQVLLNLIKNAIDAMDGAQVPRVEIRVRRSGEGMAEVSVTDHGSGIAPEHLPSLFEPFFSTKADGMGIGLNICRSIVEFHRGRLTVEPNPAGGTVMRFTLPLAAPSGAARPSSAEPT
jgi:PAS domain S-box-containing protein